MAKDTPKVEDDPGADERFKRGIANALKMPPKPHKRTGDEVAAPSPGPHRR